ncbi:hypothetical protein, partial [Variovorax sp. YR216]|uniref:hypothetical protein n=1 Tax=Variovorax sp. YR216 TaxID=1882828 RepID=UPI001C40BACD
VDGDATLALVGSGRTSILAHPAPKGGGCPSHLSESGLDVAALASRCISVSQLVIDPFAGSGNTLYWLLRTLPDARTVAFENDPLVYELSSRNLALLDLPLRLECTDFSAGLEHVRAAPDELVLAFVAPPWGHALDSRVGLDLARTEPPIVDIVESFVSDFEGNQMLFAIQVHERMEPKSLAGLVSRFDAYELMVYGLHHAGQNDGILMGSLGWTPRARRTPASRLSHLMCARLAWKTGSPLGP